MDFILGSAAADDPDQFELVRAGEEKPLTPPEIAAEWEYRLLGKAHDAFLRAKLPPEAVLRKLEAMEQANRVLMRAATKGARDALNSPVPPIQPAITPLPPKPLKQA